MAVVINTSEVARLRIDTTASGQIPSVKITDMQGHVEISGLLMKDVTDLIYTLKQAQVQVVTMLTKTADASHFPGPDGPAAD